MANPDIGQDVASAYERVYPKKPTDNIFNSFATLKAFDEKGFKVTAPGGRLFECPIEYAENTTNQMVTEFQQLDVTRIDVFDAARYDEKICAGTVSYSWLQMLKTQGDEAKFDLIEGLIENERNSHLATLSRQFWNTSTPGAAEITAIPTIISSTPTTGTVGGINAANFSFWRNRQNSGAKTTTIFDNLVSQMNLTWNQCSLGGVRKTPTALVSDLTTFNGYQSQMTTLLRYKSEDLKSGDIGWQNSAISYKGTPYFYDEDAPSATLYMLNNEVLKFEYLAGAWMKLFPAVDPANQLMNVHKLATVGNLICSARRHLGVVTVTTS